jgi:beta-xylosidase
VGVVYVLVFLLNRHREANGSKQEVGLATAKSLDGPWTESPLNPVIPASGKMDGANINHASNPTFVAAPDGKFRIYYKAMTDRHTRKQAGREICFAVSDKIEGPYVNYEHNPVISYVEH